MRTKIAAFVVVVALAAGLAIFQHYTAGPNGRSPDAPKSVSATFETPTENQEAIARKYQPAPRASAEKRLLGADVCPENEYAKDRDAVYCYSGKDPADVNSPYRNMSQQELEALVVQGYGGTVEDSGYAAWHLAMKHAPKDVMLGFSYAVIAAHHLGSRAPIEDMIANYGAARDAVVRRDLLPYLLYAYSLEAEGGLDLSLPPEDLMALFIMDRINMRWLSTWFPNPEAAKKWADEIREATGEDTTWQKELAAAVESAKAIGARASFGSSENTDEGKTGHGGRGKGGAA